VIAAVALAAAAALIWIARRPAAGPEHAAIDPARVERHGTVVPLGEARFELGAIAPDETVRVRDGVVRVTVTPLGAGERFRVIVDDAEIEVRGTELDVEVRADHIQSVACTSGVVEVRPSYAEAVLLEAGERWDAPKLAVEVPVAPAPVVEPVAVQPEPEPAKPAKADPPRRAPKVQTSTGSATSPIKVPVDAPGEAEFRAGWASLKAGKPADAADSFAAARQAKGSAVAEDASFWEGIALARAGKSSKAIAALRRFVSKYPSSSRAGEAAAKLGWLLHDAGDLDGAERYFKLASDDVVPKVRKSARDGLESIARKREAP
jgi:TolA-binding protein